MSKRQHAVIRWCVLVAAIVIAVLSGKLEAQSRRVPDVPSSKQSTTTPTAGVSDASSAGWDYRILTVQLSHSTPRVQRRSADSLPTFSNVPRPTVGRSLEEQIRELADQGYEVQSFNVVPPACGSRDFESEAEVVVLLRRMKK
jgi:hypothetical protein